MPPTLSKQLRLDEVGTQRLKLKGVHVRKPGRIFIINNNKFWRHSSEENDWHLKERLGSERDVAALKETFQGLGWEVSS